MDDDWGDFSSATTPTTSFAADDDWGEFTAPAGTSFVEDTSAVGAADHWSPASPASTLVTHGCSAAGSCEVLPRFPTIQLDKCPIHGDEAAALLAKGREFFRNVDDTEKRHRSQQIRREVFGYESSKEFNETCARQDCWCWLVCYPTPVGASKVMKPFNSKLSSISRVPTLPYEQFRTLATESGMPDVNSISTAEATPSVCLEANSPCQVRNEMITSGDGKFVIALGSKRGRVDVVFGTRQQQVSGVHFQLEFCCPGCSVPVSGDAPSECQVGIRIICKSKNGAWLRRTNSEKEMLRKGEDMQLFTEDSFGAGTFAFQFTETYFPHSLDWKQLQVRVQATRALPIKRKASHT